MRFFKKKEKFLPEVTVATSCWEGDWKYVLLEEDFIKTRKIANHDFPFTHKMLIVNNVKDYKKVLFFANKFKEKNILSHIYLAKDYEKEMLRSFQLKKEDFISDGTQGDQKWVYYNAIAPLSAIYLCKTKYLLYMTGDVWLDEKVNWIEKSIKFMEKKEKFKVANPTWNHKYLEAKKESYRKKGDFYLANEGFSDQCFLIKVDDFQKPIYNESRSDAAHFPGGEVFEKRVFSFMKNHGWERITFRRGSYIHKSFE